MARSLGRASLVTLLVVEDDAGSASSFKILLETLGYQVRVAEDATSALAVLTSTDVDAVLCDLKLPGKMSGLDLAAVIRRDPDLKELPLVAVTGYGQPDDRELTNRAGFDAHLVKPVNLPELERVLSQLVEN